MLFRSLGVWGGADRLYFVQADEPGEGDGSVFGAWVQAGEGGLCGSVSLDEGGRDGGNVFPQKKLIA